MNSTSTLPNTKIKKLEIGSVIKGRIIKKKSKEVYVDLSPYGIGRIYGYFYLKNKNLINQVNEGEEVMVKILGFDDGYGNFEIELQDYHYLNNWQKIKELMNNKEILELEVKEANRGGLIVELEGIKGFIPVSQLTPENYPRVQENDKKQILDHLNKFVNKKLKLKIISFDPSNNKLIFSERATNLDNYQKILSQFKIGQIIEVEISGISSFGLFVVVNKEPQIDGLIHISEIPEKFKNLEESFSVGQTIRAQVIKIDNDRVNLSLKYLSDDPWLKFIAQHQTGDIIEGKVIEKNDDIFAVIEINGVKGIVLNNLEKIEVDQYYQFKISSLDPKEKKLILDLVTSEI
ncbi:MAG: S1 RNA-binding domain-containing protein [Patescibacteria group bacterium]|nr:S1 RNA-binding domain-containing protein [Patescibacteria group bacterium]